MNETLGENGFSQGSILHVEKGIQLTEDDVMIQFFKYRNAKRVDKKLRTNIVDSQEFV